MIKKLPYKLFLSSFDYVPRIALNLVIQDSGKILLTRRARKPFINFWHLPGGFLLKGESIEACLKRIAKDEVDLDSVEKPKLVGVFEDLDNDPRGHVIDILYELKLKKSIHFKLTKETTEFNFFDELPENIGFNHRDILFQLGHK